MENLTRNITRFKQLLESNRNQKLNAGAGSSAEVTALVEQLEGGDWQDLSDLAHAPAERPFRLPVISSPGEVSNTGMFSGTLVAGTMCVGDPVRISPEGRSDRIKALSIDGNEVEKAETGQQVDLTLEATATLGQGACIAASEHPAEVASQFNVHLVWLAQDKLFAGREYLFKTINRVVGGQVTDIKYRIDNESLDHLATKTLGMNDIGVCNIALDTDIAFDNYESNPVTGAFWILDRQTEMPLAAGIIDFALRRSANIHRQSMDADKQTRARQKNQKPTILWLTGLSGSGKSTIANAVEQQLLLKNRHTYVLDGDNVRHGLNQDLGFTDADRVENIRRIGEVAKLMVDAGLVVMTSFISPFRAERDMVRRLVDEGEFVEIFVDTPLDACAERDPKGLYKKAKAGQIKNFTGIDSPYEAPENPELHLDTLNYTAEQCAQQVMDFLTERGYLS